jgi:hypothetical protein
MTAFLVYLFCLVLGFIFVLGTAVLAILEATTGMSVAAVDTQKLARTVVIRRVFPFFSPTVMAAFVTPSAHSA